MVYLLKIVIFYNYVKLSEGNLFLLTNIYNQKLIVVFITNN